MSVLPSSLMMKFVLGLQEACLHSLRQVVRIPTVIAQ